MNQNAHKLLEALSKQAEAELSTAEYNLVQYLDNPVAIGEHGDIAEEAMKMVSRIADAQDKIDVIENIKLQPKYENP